MAFDACVPFDTVEYDGSTSADLQETGRLVEKTGQRAVIRQLDARDFRAVSDFVADGMKELSRLDIAVVNHGVALTGKHAGDHRSRVGRDDLRQSERAFGRC